MVDFAKLSVRLELENKKLTKELNKSSKDFKRFENQARKSAKAVKSSFSGLFAGLGAGLALRGLTSAVNRTLDANDQIAKLSQTTGLLVEDLNALDLAARISGTSMEAVSKGVGRLQRNMFDAVAGLKESKEAFEALGIAVQDQDGNLRDTQDVLLDVAEKFSAIEDGAGKAALAQRIFGRAGTQLIPLLNQGRDAITRYTDEQRLLGNVLTEEVAKASERVNDNFTRLDVASEGLSRSFTTGILPALESITDALVDTAKGTNDASEQFGKFGGNILRTGVSALLVLKAGLDTTASAIGKWSAVVGEAVFGGAGSFSRAFAIMNDETGGFVDNYTQAAQSIITIWSDVGADVVADADKNSDKIAAPLVLAAEKSKKAAAAIAKTVDDLAFDEIDAEFKALDKQEAKKLAGTAGPTAQENRAAEIFEETRTPAEKLAKKIEELNTLFDEGAFGAGEEAFDTFSRGIFAAQDEFDDLVDKAEETSDALSVFAEQAARNMQDDFAEFLFDPFKEDGLKGMLDGFVDTLRQMAAQAAAAKIFESLGAGLSGQGGFLGAIGGFIAPATRAGGGPLAANQPAIVGESGRELFIPDRAGTIISNDQMSGFGGVTVNVTMPDSGVSTQSPAQFGFEVARALRIASGRNG